MKKFDNMIKIIFQAGYPFYFYLIINRQMISMRTFFPITATAALIMLTLTSCGSDPTTAGQEKELVYEGSMLEPQIGEQAAARVTADTVKGNMAVWEMKSK